MTQEKKQEITFNSVLAEADNAQKVISGKQESVAQHLFILAQGCTSADQFESGCAAAESARKTRLTEKAANAGMAKKERQAYVRLPGAWSNAKSVILRGWEDFGLIPNDSESYSQYKELKTQAVKARKSPKKSMEQGEGGENGVDVEIQRAKSVTEVLFNDLLDRVAKLPTEVQEEIISKYEPKVDVSDNESMTDAEALEAAQIRAVSQ